MMITCGKLLNYLWGLPVIIGVFLLFLLINLKFRLAKQLAGASFKKFDTYFNRQKIKTILFLGAFLMIFIAVLAPQWGDARQVVNQSGRRIVIALDVSKSMLAQDLKPNRLDCAKNKIKKLLVKLVGEQVGLILFAGDAIVMCPLTSDQDLLLSFLDEVDYQTISGGTTNLAKAILSAVNLFAQVGAGGTNLLAIFTDGEDFSQDLGSVGSLAKEAGINIFTFGVATLQGAPVPELDLNGKPAGFIKNKQGEIVISRLNQNLLQEVAFSCAGQTVVVENDHDDDLDQVASWVERFERNQFAAQTLTIKPEKYYYFALAALIFLLIEWIL